MGEAESLGDYYIEAVEWMSPMGLDLGVNYGPFPGREEYRVICRREHTLVLSVLEAMQPLGSVPLAENSKMNVLGSLGVVWEVQSMSISPGRKALSSKSCSVLGLLCDLLHFSKVHTSILTIGSMQNTADTAPYRHLPCDYSFHLLYLNE